MSLSPWLVTALQTQVGGGRVHWDMNTKMVQVWARLRIGTRTLDDASTPTNIHSLAKLSGAKRGNSRQ